MTESSDFFEAQHQRLANGYTLEDGSPENCVELAIIMSGYLRMDKMNPEILHLTGTEDDRGGFKPLWPLPYDYHLKWRGHTICVAEGVVYDPILESPVPLEDYPKVAFGTDILVRKSVFDINPTLYAAEIDRD